MLEYLLHNTIVLLVTTGLLGLLVGSFLNVVILRLPARLMYEWQMQARELLPSVEAEVLKPPPDLVFTRSHCSQCNHQLSPLENIPLLSFLWLRGRCRMCQCPISWQYPVVETLTAILSMLVVFHLGMSTNAILILLVTWMLIALAGIDLRTQFLPDQMTLPLLWLALLSSVWSIQQPPTQAILGASIGYLSLWSVYWGFKLLTGKEGMGYGDFKLMAALGALVGVYGILPIVLLSSIIGTVIGSVSLILQGKTHATPIPFGPFLALAGWIQIVYGDVLANWFFRWMGI